MENKEIIKFIFNDSNKIDNSVYSWNFIKQIINADAKNYELDTDNFKDLYIWKSGKWYNGTWNNGTWRSGFWKSGVWKSGTWYNGLIYNPKTKQYEHSTVAPNKCEWSLSYEK